MMRTLSWRTRRDGPRSACKVNKTLHLIVANLKQTRFNRCVSGITPKNSALPKRLGRADRLRPIAGPASAGSAMVAAVLISLGAFTSVDLSRVFRTVTIIFAWISVIFASIKLVTAALRPRGAPPDLSDADLPDYTVIIPLFREAHMVPGLIKALAAMDYPKDKLDIIFACEAVDPETVAAAQAQSSPPFRTLVVPPVRPGGEPQTKPRALNYVLHRSRGELVTIYDAEDRPDPKQLRRAASAFAERPHWIALQAPLDYFNAQDSWLAAQFTLEYASLFHVLLPAFDRLGLPFPLGGTSNHIRRDALIAAGGWDPYNVTEDADLAFRLGHHTGAGRHHIGWISPPTQEEAVSQLKPWLRQRSRWLKGYMQTWRVHMGEPIKGGWRRALMLQLTLGLSLLAVFFYAPVLIGLALFLLSGAVGLHDHAVPYVYIGTLIFACLCGMASGAIGALRSARPSLLKHVPLMPIYWALLFPPLIRAAWELRTNPFYWHKTEHGTRDIEISGS